MEERRGYEMKLPVVERKSGYNQISTEESEMMMDIGLVKLSKGQVYESFDPTKECVMLLLEGKITFEWENMKQTVVRSDLFHELPFVLHVCRDTHVKVTAFCDSELIQQKATNPARFENHLYQPTDSRNEMVWKGYFDDCAVREVVTTIDYSINPNSKLVIGEVINHPGKWSSYIPHSHPQPEVYFYRFDKPQGFGAAFEGDDVYKSVDYSFSMIRGERTHPQVAAPGYAMYFCWMIRHFEDQPWTSRNDDADHKWLLEKEVKIWKNK